MIVDSNIIISAYQNGDMEMRRIAESDGAAVSIVSMVEALGYHQLADEDKRDLEDFFAGARVLEMTDEIVLGAIALRQRRSMGLGDSIIAATALAHGRALVTRNVGDFRWIEGLEVIDPVG